MKKALFLRWALFAVLVSVGAIIAANVEIYDNLNVFEFIYAKDITKFSFVIMAIFVVMSAWCGILTWRANNDIEIHDAYNEKIKDIEIKADNGWFAAAECQVIGFMGTIVGFMIVLTINLGNVDNVGQQAIKELIAQLVSGMSVALISTFVGAICSLFLRTQYQNLSNAIDRQKIFHKRGRHE